MILLIELIKLRNITFHISMVLMKIH